MRYRSTLSALIFAGALSAQSAVVTLNFDTLVTGDTPGGSNIATLMISDVGANTVMFSLTHNPTSAAGQFIGELWFSLSPYTTMTPSGETPGNKFNGFSQGFNTEQNAGLNFDGNQSFKTSNSGNGVNRLKPGEAASFMISGSGIDAMDFLSTAPPTGQQRDDIVAMIHLQGIDGGGSAKLGAVPEPATLGALSIGLLALLRKRRRA